MSRLTAFSLQVLARPFAAARQRRHDRAAAHNAVPEQAGESGEHERLERIAVYARAGYFNMGYTPDMFPFIGDLPPH
jgi:hypothetical protein